jgi:hypothetical protein
MKATLRPGASPAAPTKPSIPSGPETITDSLKRKLTLRTLSLPEEQDLIASMGMHADNDRTLGRAMMAARIAMIDGTVLAVPVNNRLYRAMLTQVGHAGVEAVFRTLVPDIQGEPVAILPGSVDDYRLQVFEDGVGVYLVADAPAADQDIELAKK